MQTIPAPARRTPFFRSSFFRRKPGPVDDEEAPPPPQPTRTLLAFIVITLAALALGIFFVWFAADRASHITTEQSEGLVAHIEALRGPMSVNEAAQLRVAARGVFPNATEQQIETLVDQTARIAAQMGKKESDRIATFMEETIPKILSESVRVVLLRDFGIALLVAVGLIYSLEWYTRQRMQEETRGDVIQATFQRLIPQPIFVEVQRNIIAARAVRRKWRIAMTMDPVPIRTSGYVDLYRCSTHVSYYLRNTSHLPYRSILRSALDENASLSVDGVTLPRYVRVKIGDETFEGENLRLIRDETKFMAWKHDVRVGDSPVFVAMEIEELVSAPGSLTWRTSQPAVDAEVIINVPPHSNLRAKLIGLHSGPDRLVEVHEGHAWRLTGGLLPWQGFQIEIGREPDTTVVDPKQTPVPAQMDGITQPVAPVTAETVAAPPGGSGDSDEEARTSPGPAGQ